MVVPEGRRAEPGEGTGDAETRRGRQVIRTEKVDVTCIVKIKEWMRDLAASTR
jgi:hypothetical protein